MDNFIIAFYIVSWLSVIIFTAEYSATKTTAQPHWFRVLSILGVVASIVGIFV